jgi:phage terminase large subunit
MSAGVSAVLDRLQEGLGELQAYHHGRKGLEDFQRYATDPVGFLREVLRVEYLWEKQADVALLVAAHPLVAVSGCNGSGKDWLAARIALWWVYARRGMVLLTGPTERQTKLVCMAEVARAFAGAPDLPGKLFEGALKLDSTDAAGIVAFTTTDSSRFTGFHAPSLLVVVTEAQAVDPFVFEGIFANAVGEDSRVLLVGNPLFDSGRFFECFRSPSWATMKLSALSHPNITEGRNVIPGAITLAGVERIAQEYGRDSMIYRSRVLAEFPDHAVESLIRRSWCEAAADRFEAGDFGAEYHPKLNPNAEPEDWVAALDPARLGVDKSAVAARQGPVLRSLTTWSAKDTMETCGLVLQQLRDLRVPLDRSKDPPSGTVTARLIIDEVGLGAGVLDRLHEQGYAVEGFNGGRTPSARASVERFHNQRAESYWHLRELLEGNKIALPRNAQLFDELCATQWKVNSTGKVILESKDELKARLGRSPDLADAVSMCFKGFGIPSNFTTAPVYYGR